MTLRFSENQPKGVLDVVGRHLGELDLGQASTLSGSDLNNPMHLSAGVQVHNVSLEAIASGKMTGAAEPGLWRFYVHNEKEIMAELELETSEGEPRLVAQHAGPRSAGSHNAITAAFTEKRFAEGEYELRIIQSAGIHFNALWISGDANYFIPITPDQTPLEDNGVYSEGDCLETLQPLAASALENMASDKEGHSAG